MTMQDQTKQAEATSAAATATPSAVIARDGEASLPDDALMIVPVRNVVLFPGIVMPLGLGRPRSIAAAQAAARAERPFGVLLQREPEVDDPAPDQLHQVGTVAGILRYITAPDGNHHVVCQGSSAFGWWSSSTATRSSPPGSSGSTSPRRGPRKWKPACSTSRRGRWRRCSFSPRCRPS